ncbi:GYD domain-containing protein [Pseudoxanthomonas kaohsiungensis]|uniref:GYD domain-containing protein n=1 Tax=Pseudoxanthomonas kaohsiungensis TaxID=283923 RepID=UPI0035B13E1C
MPTFITQGRYTPEAIRGMLSNPDEDRAASLAQLFAASGGKLLSYYMTFGDYDFVIVSEGPYEGVAPSTIVTAASGSVTELKTTIAVPATEMKTLLAKAGKLATGFKPAGVRSAANA